MYETIKEFKIMATGGDLDGIRTQYYKGWTDIDFADALQDITRGAEL